MNYKLKLVKDGENENKRYGYQIYTDGNSTYYSVFVKDGKIDMASWASLMNNYLMERDMPIFTREYCEYQGTSRKEYDTITIENQ